MKIKLPIILSLSLVINAYAGSATWNRHPENDDWNDPLNWTPNTVPNGPFDIATFSGPTDTPDIKISDSSYILLDSLIIDASVPNETPHRDIRRVVGLGSRWRAGRGYPAV